MFLILGWLGEDIIVGTDFVNYTPLEGYLGEDFFIYYLRVGSIQSAAATVAITVVEKGGSNKGSDEKGSNEKEKGSKEKSSKEKGSPPDRGTDLLPEGRPHRRSGLPTGYNLGTEDDEHSISSLLSDNSNSVEGGGGGGGGGGGDYGNGQNPQGTSAEGNPQDSDGSLDLDYYPADDGRLLPMNEVRQFLDSFEALRLQRFETVAPSSMVSGAHGQGQGQGLTPQGSGSGSGSRPSSMELRRLQYLEWLVSYHHSIWAPSC